MAKIDLSPDPKLRGCLPATEPIGSIAAGLRRAIAALPPDPVAEAEIGHALITLNPVPVVLGAAPVRSATGAGLCRECGARVEA